MHLPYENATSGERAIEETRRILAAFGCTRFGTMTDTEKGCLILQFSHQGCDVTVTASFKGYATAWMKRNPFSTRKRCGQKDYERKALAQAEISVCSILRDWVKGQVTAVECNMLSFEEAFLGQILLPNGRTVMQAVEDKELVPRIGATK